MKKIIIILTFLASTFCLSFASLAYADCSSSVLSTKEAIQCGSTGAGGETTTPDKAAGKADSTITQIINLMSVAGGILAVIMLIIGGLRYILSNGDSNKTANAKNTIVYALIGLVIIAVAQVLVKTVVDKATQP